MNDQKTMKSRLRIRIVQELDEMNKAGSPKPDSMVTDMITTDPFEFMLARCKNRDDPDTL